VACRVFGVDESQSLAEQCGSDASALGAGMNTKGLEIPDRLVGESSFQCRSGLVEA
jgi:hypothetical protein